MGVAGCDFYWTTTREMHRLILTSAQFFSIIVAVRMNNAQRLTAVNHSSHAFYLYLQVRNTGTYNLKMGWIFSSSTLAFVTRVCRWFSRSTLPDAPPRDEPANVVASIRKRICADITSSGLFPVIHMSPVPLDSVKIYRHQANYIKTFYQLFSFSQSKNTFVYTNAYTL